MEHIQKGDQRIILSDSNGDNDGSIDSTIAVKRKAVHSRDDPVSMDTDGRDITHDLENNNRQTLEDVAVAHDGLERPQSAGSGARRQLDEEQTSPTLSFAFFETRTDHQKAGNRTPLKPTIVCLCGRELERLSMRLHEHRLLTHVRCKARGCGKIDLESRRRMHSKTTGHQVYDIVSEKTLKSILQPSETVECDVCGKMLRPNSLKQHKKNMHAPRQKSGQGQGTQLQASATNDGQSQNTAEVSTSGEISQLVNTNVLAASESDENTDSPWQSRSESGDEDADAYDREVAEACGRLPNKKEMIWDPVIGEVYQCLWDGNDGGLIQPIWYYVTRLPFGNYDEIGVSGYLQNSLLCDKANLPSCCRKPANDQGCVTWAPGFEDGGPYIFKRKLPFLFLQDGLYIPPSAEEFSIPMEPPFTAWVEIKKLRPESYQHLPGHNLTGITQGRAVVDAFKSRLEAIRASREAGRQNGYPRSLIPFASTLAVGNIAVELVS